MASFVISLAAAIVFALIYERAEGIANLVTRIASNSLPAEFRHERAEEWIADVEAVEGKLWKVITSLGLLWHCRLELLSRVPGVKLTPRFVVWDIWGENFLQRMIFPTEVAIKMKQSMNEAIAQYEAAAQEECEPESQSKPPKKYKHVVRGWRVFSSFTIPPELLEAPASDQNQAPSLEENDGFWILDAKDAP